MNAELEWIKLDETSLKYGGIDLKHLSKAYTPCCLLTALVRHNLYSVNHTTHFFTNFQNQVVRKFNYNSSWILSKDQNVTLLRNLPKQYPLIFWGNISFIYYTYTTHSFRSNIYEISIWDRMCFTLIIVILKSMSVFSFSCDVIVMVILKSLKCIT